MTQSAPVEGTRAPHLRLVPYQLADVIVRRAHVPLENVPVPAAARQHVRAPGQAAHPHAVPTHRPNFLTPGRVPDLHLAQVRTHRQVRTALRPPHRGDAVVGPQIA